MTLIRQARYQDHVYIHEIYMHAFAKDEAKNVATLACNLLVEASFPKTYSIIAEVDNNLIGHVAFSPLRFDSSNELRGYILAPLAVKPGFQKKSIGSNLVKFGIEQLTEQGIDVILVYGDPKYYGRFGFDAKCAIKYLPPFKLQYPFGWLAITLSNKGCIEHKVKVSCVNSLHIPVLW